MDRRGAGLGAINFASLTSPAYLAAATEIARALAGAGYRALFVGGAVRNALLGLPLKDIDLATDATPDQIAALFAESRTVGAHFGVQLVRRKGRR